MNKVLVDKILKDPEATALAYLATLLIQAGYGQEVVAIFRDEVKRRKRIEQLPR